MACLSTCDSFLLSLTALYPERQEHFFCTQHGYFVCHLGCVTSVWICDWQRDQKWKACWEKRAELPLWLQSSWLQSCTVNCHEFLSWILREREVGNVCKCEMGSSGNHWGWKDLSAKPPQLWRAPKLWKVKLHLKVGSFNYLQVLSVLKDEYHLFKICFEYLSTSIFETCYFQGPKSLLVDSSFCPDFAISAVVECLFTEGLFMGWWGKLQAFFTSFVTICCRCCGWIIPFQIFNLPVIHSRIVSNSIELKIFSFCGTSLVSVKGK